MLPKKEVKAFFKEIKNGNKANAAELLTQRPELANCCASAPPKKDDGQSPLQVALKNGRFDIAELLLGAGADVNFQEISTVNEWTAPVLHDCIRAALFSSIRFKKDEHRFSHAVRLLKSILAAGANPNASDSYGNTALHRALLDARQILVSPCEIATHDTLPHQVRSVFQALMAAGADPSLASEKRPTPASMLTLFQLEAYELMPTA